MIAPFQVLCVFYAAIRSIVALLPKVLTAVGNARYVMRVELTGLVLMPIAFWIGSHSGTGASLLAGFLLTQSSPFWNTGRL